MRGIKEMNKKGLRLASCIKLKKCPGHVSILTLRTICTKIHTLELPDGLRVKCTWPQELCAAKSRQLNKNLNYEN